jgi:hypothetical protein
MKTRKKLEPAYLVAQGKEILAQHTDPGLARAYQNGEPEPTQVFKASVYWREAHPSSRDGCERVDVFTIARKGCARMRARPGFICSREEPAATQESRWSSQGDQAYESGRATSVRR